MNRRAATVMALVATGLLGTGSPAHAVFTCTIININSVTQGYTSTDTLETVTTSGFSVNCNRDPGDPIDVTVYLGADNGAHASGQTNNAQHLASTAQIQYELYKSSGRAGSDRWTGNTKIPVTIFFASATVTTSSASGTFQVAAPPGQTAGAAGTYVDSPVVASLYMSNTGNPPAVHSMAFSVTYIKEPTCILTTPTNVQFVYASFSISAASSTGGAFSVTCSANLPYTMALDQTSVTDQALNLNYTLSIAPAASSVGTGAAQAMTVLGSMAAGQGGTCGGGTCNNSLSTNRTRTLTITY